MGKRIKIIKRDIGHNILDYYGGDRESYMKYPSQRDFTVSIDYDFSSDVPECIGGEWMYYSVEIQFKARANDMDLVEVKQLDYSKIIEICRSVIQKNHAKLLSEYNMGKNMRVNLNVKIGHTLCYSEEDGIENPA